MLTCEDQFDGKDTSSIPSNANLHGVNTKGIHGFHWITEALKWGAKVNFLNWPHALWDERSNWPRSKKGHWWMKWSRQGAQSWRAARCLGHRYLLPSQELGVRHPYFRDRTKFDPRVFRSEHLFGSRGSKGANKQIHSSKRTEAPNYSSCFTKRHCKAVLITYAKSHG